MRVKSIADNALGKSSNSDLEHCTYTIDSPASRSEMFFCLSFVVATSSSGHQADIKRTVKMKNISERLGQTNTVL